MELSSLVSGCLLLVLVLISSSAAARPSRGNNGPGPVTIPGFQKFAHGVSSGDVIVLDTKTIRIKGFNYDGSAPDVFFWVGKGGRPNGKGTQIQDERGTSNKLGSYRNKDIELALPRDISVADIDYVSVWCRKYSTNFGHVTIPKDLNVPVYSD